MNTKTILPILEAMRDFPDLEKDIKKAEKEYKRGSYLTLENVLSKEGFVLADNLQKRPMFEKKT